MTGRSDEDIRADLARLKRGGMGEVRAYVRRLVRDVESLLERSPVDETALTRRIRFEASYDYRDHPTDRRGAHGADVRFVLQGPLGAICATVSTGWMERPLANNGYVPGRKQIRRDRPGPDGTRQDPSGVSIMLHCAEDRTGYWNGPQECDLLPGGTCYSDGRYLASDDFLRILIADGEEGAWAHLEGYYQNWLGIQTDA